jgi:disulfide bond formation protein DsbB
MSPQQRWDRPPRRIGLQVVVGAFMLTPLPVSIVCLVIGLFGPMIWIYLAIAFFWIWFIALLLGIKVLGPQSRQDERWEFNAPPGWPRAPASWTPQPGWQPDPTWVAAPADWKWWIRTGS